MTDGAGRLTVFLDRDGVINRRRPDHVKSWEEFEFLPGSLEALAQLREIEARVIVITNQAAVGRGLIGQEDLARLHSRMTEIVRESGGLIEGIYACPHLPEARCACRKPGTELFMRASSELGVDLNDSFMIGDSPTDVLAANAVGCRPVFITEENRGQLAEGCLVARDLLEAVHLIAAETARAGVMSC